LYQSSIALAMGSVERDFVARWIDSHGYARRVHALWGDLTEAHVAAAFQEAPWLRRIRYTLE
ncbi:hypothetical protein, partial [Klebsiella aerogenes]|uniref:hypothetical protein n=1 Tax=Klebsiella aerogenes TaxID=548 RepID=UPI00195448B4